MDFNNISTTECGSLRNILKKCTFYKYNKPRPVEIKLLLAEYTLLHIFALICTHVLQNQKRKQDQYGKKKYFFIKIIHNRCIFDQLLVFILSSIYINFTICSKNLHNKFSENHLQDDLSKANTEIK